MEFRATLHRLVMQYFYILAGTFMGAAAYCAVFLPNGTLPVSLLWELMAFSLLADLPGLVYYSKKELTRRQWTIRTVLHTVLLLVVLLTAARLIGLYSGLYSGLFFAFIIICVDVFVRLMTYTKDSKMADEINKKLKQRKAEERQ